jgi:hypothetical protein
VKCRDCKYWVEVAGFLRHEDTGGCTFTTDKPRYYPMFLDEECNLIEPYKTQVENEHREEGAKHD